MMNRIKRMFSHAFRRKEKMLSPIELLRKKGAKIGEDCSIYEPFVAFGSEPYLVEVGNHVRITCGVRLLTHDGGTWVFRMHQYAPKELFYENAERFGRIKIGNNVHIANNVTILPNVSIGDNTVIAAHAVVTKSFPSGVVIGGVPARVIETIEEYYQKHCASFHSLNNLSAEEKEKFLRNSL